jgi:hypothetical protein
LILATLLIAACVGSRRTRIGPGRFISAEASCSAARRWGGAAERALVGHDGCQRRAPIRGRICAVCSPHLCRAAR